jgi:uncharacterized protein
VTTPRWHTREDSGLVLDENVVWWHDGTRIEHPNIIEAFNRGLSIEAETGRAKLTFGNDWAYVEVRGCPFKVVAIDEADARLSVRLSDRTAEWLAVDTLALDSSGRLTVAVKSGQARALLSREAQFELAQRFELVEGRVKMAVRGHWVALPIDFGSEE